MIYNKPEVVVLASPVNAIQRSLNKTVGYVENPFTQQTISAYEADE